MRLSKTERWEVALMVKIELIVVEDLMGNVRTKGYAMLENELYQNIRSVILLEKNG
jgi:hypothetical protein